VHHLVLPGSLLLALHRLEVPQEFDHLFGIWSRLLLHILFWQISLVSLMVEALASVVHELAWVLVVTTHRRAPVET
jgi:hypothetical protein